MAVGDKCGRCGFLIALPVGAEVSGDSRSVPLFSLGNRLRAVDSGTPSHSASSLHVLPSAFKSLVIGNRISFHCSELA